jgi:hypothetical protein
MTVHVRPPADGATIISIRRRASDIRYAPRSGAKADIAD